MRMPVLTAFLLQSAALTPLWAEGDPVLRVSQGKKFQQGLNVAVLCSPTTTITRGAFDEVPSLPLASLTGGCAVNLGPTDAEGTVKVPDFLNFGKPGTTALVKECPKDRSLWVINPGATLAPEDESCRKEAQGQGHDRDEDCKCRKVPFLWNPTRVEIPNDGSFFGSPWTWGLTALGAGATYAAVSGGGSGGSGTQTPTATTNPGTPNTPGSGPTDPGGPYGFDWRVIDDPRNSARFVRLQDAREGRIVLNGTAVTITGQPPLPPLMGTWSPASEQITASGAGPLAARPMVGVTLAGTLTAAGALNATVTVGEDGSLGAPLPHVVRYGLTGTRWP